MANRKHNTWSETTSCSILGLAADLGIKFNPEHSLTGPDPYYTINTQLSRSIADQLNQSTVS